MAKHFDPCVPFTVQNKILNLVAEAKEDSLLTDLFSIEAIGEHNIDDILGVSCGGYIPFQDGGYSLNVLGSSGYYSGEAPTPQYQAFLNMNEDNVRAAWLLDNPSKSLDNQEHLEEFYNVEYDYLGDTEPLIRLCLYVKDNKVHITLSLGYSDAPYYRDKYDEYIMEKEVDFDTFESMTYAQLKDMLQAGLKEYLTTTEGE